MKNDLLLKRLFVVVLILMLLITGLPFLGNLPVAHDEQAGNSLPIDMVQEGRTKLDSVLDQLDTVLREQGVSAAIDFAEQTDIDFIDGKVRVVIDTIPGKADAGREIATILGATIEDSYENLIRVTIPIAQLTYLAENDDMGSDVNSGHESLHAATSPA